ncbi:hypothetical protein BX666DRAFT_2032685 [Dichotomocladium elegans]|nr:hypothetical protein BX666DRAFT_2032685 [Dichotomocladium elegans]
MGAQQSHPAGVAKKKIVASTVTEPHPLPARAALTSEPRCDTDNDYSRAPISKNNDNNRSSNRVSSYSSTSSASVVTALFSLASSDNSSIFSPSSLSSCHSSSITHQTITATSVTPAASLSVAIAGHEANSNTTITLDSAGGKAITLTVADFFASLVRATSCNTALLDRLLHQAIHPSIIDLVFSEITQLAKTDYEAFCPLAMAYEFGLTPDRLPDVNKALKWYKRTVAFNDSDLSASWIAFAHYRIGIILIATTPNKKTEAMRHFTSAASKGHPAAQYRVGSAVARLANHQHARQWYMAAARQGHADAQAALGILLMDHFDREHEQGLRFLKKAADQNNPKALYRLGTLYEEGIHVVQDIKHAISFYERAIDAASDRTSSDDDEPEISETCALAHYAIGIYHRFHTSTDQQPDYALALYHLTQSAEYGSASAQRVLGTMHAEGIATPKDPAMAHRLYQKAAAQGDLRAMGLLAQQFEQGDGCMKDLKQAIKLYGKAARAGSVIAQVSLGELLMRTDKAADAFHWFEKAAYGSVSPSEHDTTYRLKARLQVVRYRLQAWGGIARKPAWAFQELLILTDIEKYAPAYYWAGACYEEGVPSSDDEKYDGNADTKVTPMTVQRNIIKAFEYYEKSAMSGDKHGQFQVAYMLSNGISEPPMGILIPKDPVRAFQWYKAAAENGHSTAQHSLGLYYAKGLSPVKEIDTAMATSLFREAAEKGNAPSMVELAKLLLTSEQHLRDGLYWLQKAASLGDPTGMRELAAVYESDAAAELLEDKEARIIAAFQLYKKAASEKKDPLSYCALARMYAEGNSNVPQSIDDAVLCYLQAEKLGYSKAGLALGAMYESQAMWQDAMEKYTQIARDHGMLTPVGWLARMARSKLVVLADKGSAEDQKEVYSCLSDMVEHDVSDAAIEALELLGICCEYGKGTAKDMQSAITWYEAAVAVPVTKQEPNWYQERTKFRLATIHIEHPEQHAKALHYCRALEPLLDKMNHHSAETRQHARRVRYYIGYLLLHGGAGVQHNREEAKRWFREASDEGEGAAAYELGMLALAEEDDREARKRFEQGVSARHAGSMRQFALMLKFEQKDDIYWDGCDTLEWLEDAAKHNDVEALVHLGLSYEHGLGSAVAPGQYHLALPLYLAAAQQGHVRAMIRAAELYSRTGRHREAVIWLRRITAISPDILLPRVMLASYRLNGRGGLQGEEAAAVQDLLDLIEARDNADAGACEEVFADDQQMEDDRRGLGLAMFLLGQWFEDARNVSQATAWYTRAASEADHAEAMYSLGILLQNDKREAEALEWFRQAAEKGRLRAAQFQLGMYHKNGKAGLEANLMVARNYFAKASDQGHPRSKYELAHILWLKGDYQKAYLLYDVAAKLKVPEALRELGNLFHQGFKSDGFEVQRDHSRAFTCFVEAAKHGDPTAALMVGTYFEEGYLEDANVGIDKDQALRWYETSYQLGCGSLAELAIGHLKHAMAAQIEKESWEAAEDLREEAYVWFNAAATPSETCLNPQLRPEVQYAAIMVALYKINGWGRVERDPAGGMALLQETADQGNSSEAYVELAKCYEQGVDGQVDIIKALRCWELAAAAPLCGEDTVAAMVRAAEYHEQGLAGQVSVTKAAHYYRKARASGAQLDDHSLLPSSTSTSSSSSYTSSTRSTFPSLHRRAFNSASSSAS